MPNRSRSRLRSLAPFAVVLILGFAGYLGWLAFERGRERVSLAAALAGGDPGRGAALTLQHGCAACHQIPGIRGPGGKVGPPLDDIARRVYVGGMLANTPDNLVRWIVDPKGVNPKTAMPNTGISQAEARDVAAYLLSR